MISADYSVGRSSEEIAHQGMLQYAQNRLVSVCYLFLVIAGLLVLPSYIIRVIKIGWQPVSVVHVIILLLGIPVFVFRRRLSLKLKAFTLISVSLVSSFGALVSFGIVGSGFFGMGMMGCTVAALTLGRTVGLITLLISSAYYVLIMFLFLSGSFHFSSYLPSYVGSKVAWFSALGGFILPIMILIFGIDEMQKILKSFIGAINRNSKRITEEMVFRSALFDSISSIIVVTDELLVIRSVNASMLKLTGYEEAEVKGKHISELFADEAKGKEILSAISDDLRGNSSRRYEDMWVGKNGKQHQINWTFNILDLPENFTRSIIITGADMSEYRALEKKFYHAQKMESIGSLAGGIAHDFNNMLSGIIGSAEILKIINHSAGESEQHIDTIIKTSQRAASLTKQLLSFSRNESSSNELIDVNKAIEDAIQLISAGKRRSIQIERSFNNNPVIVEAESSLIVNAFLNLAINACDAMPDGGVLSFSTESFEADEEFCRNNNCQILPGRYVIVSVSDTGSGISPELRERVFEPFFTTKGKERGTGLGLSTVYGTVVRYGGMIRLYSESGIGSRFSVYLPLLKSEESSAPIMPGITSIGKLDILVADDEPSICNTIASLLSGFGHAVDTVENGKAMIEKYESRENGYDIVIIDWIMPVMGGQEAVGALLALSPDAKIIITSGFGHDHESFRDLALNDGIRFLSKPYRSEEILSLIAVLSQNARSG